MIIAYDKFTSDCLHFEAPKTNKYNGHRINVKYQTSDAIQKCYLRTPILFSWGMQSYEKTDEEVTNYSFPLVLYNAECGATHRENRFIEILKDILSRCKKYLKQKSIKDSINKKQLDGLVNEMTIMYENPPKAPTIYPKIIYNCKNKTFVTYFYKKIGDVYRRIEPVQSRCRVIADVILESIYVGTTVSLQLKVMNILLVEDLSAVRDSVFNNIPLEDAEEINKCAEKEYNENYEDKCS